MRMRAGWTAVTVMMAFLTWSASSQTAAPRSEQVSIPSENLQLSGYIWRPAGDGPFPALLWNHGSEQFPGDLPEVARAFVECGYVFFIPHRRGQGRSPGPYILDEITRGSSLLEQHEIHLRDQLAALAYLKSLRYVDANRIVNFGWSFGGIQTMMAANQNTGYRAAVNCSGAAQSWAGRTALQNRLPQGAREARMPIRFMQAENDYDLAPSRELSAQMQRAGKHFELQLYPRFGQSNQDGHEFCALGVGAWRPDVFAFYEKYLEG